jgi:Polysaccharide pyruvyl transferase
MKICLFDPGIENHTGSPSANLGDLIIQEAVVREIKSLFNDCELIHIATHSFPTQKHIALARKSDFIFVGGTNLLGSDMNRYKQWKLSLLQKFLIGRAILLGVGWQQYQVKPNFYTRVSLKTVLANRFTHSVRDSYTKEKLESAGIQNAINTGCPTMWPLVHLRQEEIASQKTDSVLVMLTDYRKDAKLDGKLLELVAAKYEKVFVWPQGREDLSYITDLVSSLRLSVTTLEHSFESFTNFLNSGIPFDYIGTRLHGGIKCLLAKKRSLILEVDNRAKEIAKDTNLPTSDRSDLQKIIQWIEQPSRFEIKINSDSINEWKSQFIKLNSNN